MHIKHHWMKGVLPAVLVAALTGCNHMPVEENSTSGTNIDSHDNAHQTSLWQDSQRSELNLADFRTAPHLVTFFYSTCTNVCPRTMASLRKLDSNLKQLSAELPVILVTLEPEDDSANSLADYRNDWGLDRENWHFVRGDHEQTLALADSLGYSVIDIEDHVFHDSTLYLFRPQETRYQAYDTSIRGQMTQLQQDIEFLLN